MSKFENLQLDNQLCFALYSATNAITRVYRQLLADHDLTYTQYLVLLVLWEQDGVAVRDVMKRLRLDSGTLSPILKRLERGGLLTKKRNDSDERIVRIFLTKKSRDMQAEIADIQHQVVCQTKLNSSDFLALLGELESLTETLRQTPLAKSA
ncbi:Organic hydroperoxide resistance transcriptional regulator [Methylophaga frappieri]|uniref:Organic hydroperoxide resistance transcriptional regulator n=1 Tax=Methylophaga frappieri (strain ATCC BAA-2434 / DSM 25690 / JAM7) TaxID=754477 RepID=I1YEN2_METFJ|nr:MarR family transcriptional regulator [Methylophaga frappieri]AFJ01375.1 Organic hydroperoxide resistance transcriptional regulator [Methylophaga frappieri]